MKRPTFLLSVAVDMVNDAHFFGRTISKPQCVAFAGQIASRQGQPGAYADTFALIEKEQRYGVHLFTGERVTGAAMWHIIGEEACRALRLLDVRDRQVKQALDRASEGLMRCLDRSEALTGRQMAGNPGLYCCGQCSVGLWRHLTAGGLDRQEERLCAGLRTLRSMRDGECGWRRFPFWYTLSALIEMDLREAVAELRHTAPLLRRAAKRCAGNPAYAHRRQEIARRALARI